MDYKVVEVSSDSIGGSQAIEREVNDLIIRGWKPQGGLSAIFTHRGATYFQAMIKEMKKNEGEK